MTKPVENTSMKNEKWRTWQMADGYAAFHWPETQALLKRLGIDVNQRIKDVTIRLAVNECPVVTLALNGVDASQEETVPTIVEQRD